MKTIHSTIPDPFFHYSFALPKEQIAFFDIETTGLSAKASSLYLIGLMYYDKETSSWKLIQWFADNYQSEKEMLVQFLNTLEDFSFLIHFNGRTFDIPYIKAKCDKHDLTISSHNKEIFEDTDNCISVDLLQQIRSVKKLIGMNKCNQTSVEQWLSIDREDTYNGGELIPVYSEYMQKRILAKEEAAALEKLLLLHNHDDIAMMLELCSLLTYCDLCSPAFWETHTLTSPVTTSMDEENGNLLLSFSVPFLFPKKISFRAGTDNHILSFTFWQDKGSIRVPYYQGSLKFFFPNYKEYYYLPKEDTAIHKSVAEFVDKQFRKKATASTCYTKKTGCFLPSLATKAPENIPLFYTDYKEKPTYWELKKDTDADQKMLTAYVITQLCSMKKKV